VTDLRILVKELLVDEAYLSKAINDKKSWFTWMEVLDWIYHLFFFTTNSFGWQRTTSQFFQPRTPQTLAFVAAAIHCAMSEYATGKKVTVMFSQDEYRGKFCPSTVTDCATAEAMALINCTWWGCLIPPPEWCSSAMIQAPQSGLVLRYSIQGSILPVYSVPLLEDGRASIPSSISIRSASIPFQTPYLPAILALLSLDGLLR